MGVKFGRELLKIGRGERCGEEGLDKRWGERGGVG